MAQRPCYKGLIPRSEGASAAARGASRKSNTKPELLLRRTLWGRGLRYHTNRFDLPGKPDIVFQRARVVVFVDGDFWHGNSWIERKAKLSRGHNADYWVKKIEQNIERDLVVSQKLCAEGWLVLRIWESEIYSDIDQVVHRIGVLLNFH